MKNVVLVTCLIAILLTNVAAETSSIAPIGAGIAYSTKGNPSDPALVLIGGMGQGQSGWGITAATLNTWRQKYFIIMYDPRGMYASPDCEDYSLLDSVQDVKDLMDYLGVQRAHVLGWSLGGTVASEFAYLYPSMVDRLILMSTVPLSQTNLEVIALNEIIRQRTGMPVDPQPSDFESLMPTLTGLSFNDETLRSIMVYLTRFIVLQDPTFYEALAQQWRSISSADTYDHLQGIIPRTLVIYGDGDRLVPAQASELIYGALTTQKELVVIPGASHGGAIENFSLVNTAIRKFLRRP
jgi:pimeloyl-ACP methyl ester carboxylesterase